MINEEEKLSLILESAKKDIETSILYHNINSFGFSEQFIERILLDDEI
jgi:hypothetical protein